MDHFSLLDHVDFGQYLGLSNIKLFALTLNNMFIDTSIYITDCSRNLDWLEWISNPGNEIMENADELLEYINAIADSYTEEDLNSSAARLEECDIWKKSEPLRAWFQSKWLRQAKVSNLEIAPEGSLVIALVRPSVRWSGRKSLPSADKDAVSDACYTVRQLVSL